MCVIAVPLPPGTNPFAVKINTNNNVPGFRRFKLHWLGYIASTTKIVTNEAEGVKKGFIVPVFAFKEP
jgi:hypothetical protein